MRHIEQVEDIPLSVIDTFMNLDVGQTMQIALKQIQPTEFDTGKRIDVSSEPGVSDVIEVYFDRGQIVVYGDNQRYYSLKEARKRVVCVKKVRYPYHH